jgi:hypothetical protein
VDSKAAIVLATPLPAIRSTLLRSGREERSPLLFDFCTAALGALYIVLLVFGKTQNCGEFLSAR